MTYIPPADPSHGVQYAQEFVPHGSYGGPHQQGNYSPPGQMYGNYAQPKPKSTSAALGTWSVVCGIFGLLIPLGINALAAVVLGIVGIVKQQKTGAPITGLILGVLGILWTPLAWGIFWTLLGTVIPLLGLLTLDY